MKILDLGFKVWILKQAVVLEAWKLQIFATTSLVSKAMGTRGKVSSRNYLGRPDVLTETTKPLLARMSIQVCDTWSNVLGLKTRRDFNLYKSTQIAPAVFNL